MADSSLNMSSTATLDAPDTRFNGVLPNLIRGWQQRRRAGSKTGTTAQRVTLAAFLRKWHKRAGVFAFGFMIWLGASGFMINQSSEWGYDTLRVDWPALMALYGLKASPPSDGYVQADHWLAKGGDNLFLDGEALKHNVGTLRGMITSETSGQPLIYVAGRESLLMLTPDGEIYDELSPPILPIRTIVSIGIADSGGVAVQGESEAHQTSDGGMTWAAVDVSQVRWSETTALSDAQRETLAPFSRPSIPAERALLDLHSGQIFGEAGVWIVNIVGILSIWLGISGIWMTLRLQRQMKQRARA